MNDVEFQDFSNRVLNVLDSGIAKFLHLMTLRTNKVVVLFISVGFFILCKVFAKLMLCNQITFYQQIQRVVNCCPADPVVFIFHTNI